MSTYSNKAKQTLSGASETTPFHVKDNGRYIATLEDLLRSYTGLTVLNVIEDIESLEPISYPTREERMDRRTKKALLAAASEIIGGNGNGQDQLVTTHEIPANEDAGKSRRVPDLVFSPRL